MRKEISDEIVDIRAELNGLAKRVSKLECAQFIEHLEPEANSSESVCLLPTKEDSSSQSSPSTIENSRDRVVFHNTVSISSNSPRKDSKNNPVIIRNLDSDNNESKKPTSFPENISDSKTTRGSTISITEPDLKNETKDLAEIGIYNKSLEEQIGSYWLNRIGIAALVIGLVLLLTYSFQFYGPVFKVATGIILAIGLIFGGEWMDFKGEPKWYARGLIGGGWSIMFFTAFALYHIPQVKLTDNFLLDWILMLAVSGLSMTHALFRKSEIMAGLSMVLSLVALGLSDVNQFAWVASGTLVCSLAYMAYKLDWYRLFFWGVLGAYGTFFVGIAPGLSIMNFSPWHEAIAVGSFIGVNWLVYNITSLFLSDYSSNRKNRLIIASLVNTLCFVPYMATLLIPLLKEWDYLFVVFIAAAYFAFYAIAKQRKQKSLLDVNLLVALSSATYSVAMFFDSSVTNVYWLMEVPVLVYLGLKYKTKSISAFAICLAFVSGIYTLIETFNSDTFAFLGLNIPVGSIHVIVASLAFGIAALVYRIPSRLNDYGKSISRMFYLYFLLSFSFIYLIPIVGLRHLPADFWGQSSYALFESACLVFWSGQCLACLLLGARLKDQFIKIVAASATILLTLNGIVLSDNVTNFSLVAILGQIVAGTGIYKVMANNVSSKENQNFFYTYFACFALFIWSLAISLFPSEFLSLRWAFEAVTIVGLGLLLKDGNIRTIGGCIFGTAMLALISQSAWSVFEVSTLITLLYLTGIVNRVIPESSGVRDKLFTAQAYELMAAVTLTTLIGKEVPNEWMTFAWSIEGFCLLVAGFALRDKAFRVSGLSLFTLVAMKLLFVDLAGAETIARILSFIVAGVILLVASYVYTRFADRFMNRTSEKVN